MLRLPRGATNACWIDSCVPLVYPVLLSNSIRSAKFLLLCGPGVTLSPPSFDLESGPRLIDRCIYWGLD